MAKVDEYDVHDYMQELKSEVARLTAEVAKQMRIGEQQASELAAKEKTLLVALETSGRLSVEKASAQALFAIADKDRRKEWEHAEAAEQKLAAAERSEAECERLLEVKMRERDTAESRCRELEALMQRDCDEYRDGVRNAQLAQRAAESELAQLRERVARAVTHIEDGFVKLALAVLRGPK